jgi:Putative MetA-pathway of phenol degradation
MTLAPHNRSNRFLPWPNTNAAVVLASAIIRLSSQSAPVRAQVAAEPLTKQDLQRALQERDALIRELLRRVERLERDLATAAGQTPPAARTVPVAEAPTTTAPPPAPPAPREPEGPKTAQTKPPAPGEVEVDQAAAERALEATLVQKGALLLPFGQAEVTPSFTYTRRTQNFPTVVNVPGGQALVEQDVRRNEFLFSGGLRVGLPLDSQLELALPYNLVDQSVVKKSNGTAFQESSGTGHGLGDFSVGLAKTVVQEGAWWPDVILHVNWDTGTGERSDNDVVLDAGFQSLTGSVSLTKRQDPLVFVGGAFYKSVFENHNIDPGDSLGFNLGTFLAASPNTSLYAILNQSFIDQFKVGGQSINGSNRVESILSLGASSILGRNVLLDGSVGIGLTDDSPDYTVSISLPIRFNTPTF